MGKIAKLCLKNVDDLDIYYYIGFRISFLIGIEFISYSNLFFCCTPAS